MFAFSFPSVWATQRSKYREIHLTFDPLYVYYYIIVSIWNCRRVNVTGHWYLSDDNCIGGGLQLKRQQTYILLLDVDKNAINQSHLKAASSTTDSSAPVDAAAAPIEFTVETEAKILKHLGELYLYHRGADCRSLGE